MRIAQSLRAGKLARAFEKPRCPGKEQNGASLLPYLRETCVLRVGRNRRNVARARS
jgi:hypothetical protein